MKLWQQISMGSGVVLAVVCLASTSLAAGNGKGKQQGGGTGICPVTGTAAQPLRDGSCGGVAGGQGTGDRLRLRERFQRQDLVLSGSHPILLRLLVAASPA